MTSNSVRRFLASLETPPWHWQIHLSFNLITTVLTPFMTHCDSSSCYCSLRIATSSLSNTEWVDDNHGAFCTHYFINLWWFNIVVLNLFLVISSIDRASLQHRCRCIIHIYGPQSAHMLAWPNWTLYFFQHADVTRCDDEFLYRRLRSIDTW